MGVTRACAALVAAALLGGCGGDARVEAADAAGCLAEDEISTAPRGDPDAATEVLAFEIPAEPVPARGLLIFVGDDERARTLAQDIADEARAQGHEAYLLREGNAIAHFLTRDAPTSEQEERIRGCLESR